MRRAKYHIYAQKSRQSVDADNGDEVKGRVLETKRNRKEFTDEVQFGVLGLASLEVVTEKMGPVMETGRTVWCKVVFWSRSACQLMKDEGQILAKNSLREKVLVLKRCKSFGIHKDGTRRKKVKIFDTSVIVEE
ncbi:hypothetical protein PoB_004515600 [Plakobranchus ocellatus]|uniref:Uncharacterized protein n=1 Tax=Plakobranchus ocellatus TaxID=259542 RepID=A0AAV4BDZ6_9GAST|nr:hypothetical protein PoB_004515600 [Plakobranchus ocellatus]